MQLSSSLRRPVALAGAAALLALPQVASAKTEVNIDKDVKATIETSDGIQKQGALDADPFTYTVKSRVKCEEPYVDGARTSFLQGVDVADIPTKDMPIVMSGVDDLVDGKAVNPIDASFVDFAKEGEASLLIECVKIDNGIPQVAPEPIVQPLTITKDEWQMNGITFTEVEDPTPAAPTEEPAPAPAEPTDGAVPAPAEPTDGAVPAPAEPTDGTAPGTGEDDDAAAPAVPPKGNDSDGGKPTGGAKTDPSKQAPAKPTNASRSDRGISGFMPRTGAEIAATAVLALALIGGGAFAVIRMRKN